MNLPSLTPQPELPPLFKDPRFWKGALVGAGVLVAAAGLWVLLSEENGAEMPPPDVKKKAREGEPESFAELSLPDYIACRCKSLFDTQHYSEAVLKAFHGLEQHMRDVLGLSTPDNLQKQIDGFNLVQEVWGKDGDITQGKVLIETKNPTEQRMAWETHGWLVKYVRNPNAHRIVQKTKADCLKHLHQISVLSNQFDSATH